MLYMFDGSGAKAILQWLPSPGYNVLKKNRSSRAMIGPIAAVLTAISTIFVPFIIIAWFLSLTIRTHFGGIDVVSPQRLFAAFLIPSILALRELSKKSLSLSGISAAVVVGFVLTISNLSFIISLLAFFYSSSKLTKFRSERKFNQDAMHETTRNWLNVLNNGGVPTGLALLYVMEIGCKDTPIDFGNPYLYTSSWLSVAVLASIASACGDTWASELGSAVGNPTSTLITTGQTVPAGTNGGVTIVGTLASLIAGGWVGLVYCVSNYFLVGSSSVLWPLVPTGMFAGFLGSLLDSFIGATMQYSGYDEDSKKVSNRPGPGVKHISGVNLLNNHAVNFISGFATAIICPVLYTYVAGL